MLRPEYLKLGENLLDNQVTGRTINAVYIGQRIDIQFDTAIGPLTVTQIGIDQIASDLQTIGWTADRCLVLPPSKV
jgi:hypothetical protein